jgi:hypothetical protein
MSIYSVQPTIETDVYSPWPKDRNNQPYPTDLKNVQEFAAHLIRTYERPLAYDHIISEFSGYRGVLRLFPAHRLVEDEYVAQFPENEARYEKMDPRTQPPLIIWDDGFIEDGHHRLRVGRRQGKTHFWCYLMLPVKTSFVWNHALDKSTRILAKQRLVDSVKAVDVTPQHKKSRKSAATT